MDVFPLSIPLDAVMGSSGRGLRRMTPPSRPSETLTLVPLAIPYFFLNLAGLHGLSLLDVSEGCFPAPPACLQRLAVALFDADMPVDRDAGEGPKPNDVPRLGRGSRGDEVLRVWSLRPLACPGFPAET